MPQIEVVFYQEQPSDVPVLDWLTELRAKKPKVYAKCVARIGRLVELGHEIRRPEADYLRDGISELRVGFMGINYRMLYFYHGREMAVLAHALTKEKEVPDVDIDRAIERRRKFESDPGSHTYRE